MCIAASIGRGLFARTILATVADLQAGIAWYGWIVSWQVREGADEATPAQIFLALG
jgi:hypothetical protein